MRPIVLLGGLAAALMCSSGVALAQKSGGVLKMYHRDNPPSASIHEEATNSTVVPFMSLFNNLVLYDQSKPQNSPQDIVPDLAKSWSWSADNKDLTFKLQEGVKWHDGQPFTAKDVVCTFDLLTGKGEQKLRRNPRQSWYGNVEQRHRQRRSTRSRSISSGRSPRSCRCSPRAIRRSIPAMCRRRRCAPSRSAPARSSSSSSSRTRASSSPGTPTTGRRARPYLDGIEFTIVPNRATAMLSFVSGRFDITFPWEVTIPLLKDIKSQLPNARVPGHLDEQHHQPDRQSRRAAVRQSRPAHARWCWRSTARPSSTS